MSLGTPQEMLDDERDYNESLKGMAAKEKAEKLVDKHLMILANVWDSLRTKEDMAKQCALVCVDEIQKVTNYEINYWEEVKQEINKLC